MKLVEFLYFYLMPESALSKAATSAANTAVLGGRGKEIAAAFDRAGRRETITPADGKMSKDTKSTEEKQALLSKHLNNVADLVEDLREGSAPFGTA